MLQFITNETSKISPADQIKQAILGGCRWIQIRLKGASDEEIRRLFDEVKEQAKESLTTIIINDRVELAKELGAEGVAGVHLGREDMLPAEARQIMGPDAIIGVTAHSFNEIEIIQGLDIDYIGIGPYATTTTKTNLAPILGLEGIAEIMFKVKDADISIPCVAVGGISLHDVVPLLEIGVNGIAVSGAIANAPDIKMATREFIDCLPIHD